MVNCITVEESSKSSALVSMCLADPAMWNGISSLRVMGRPDLCVVEEQGIKADRRDRFSDVEHS